MHLSALPCSCLCSTRLAGICLTHRANPRYTRVRVAEAKNRVSANPQQMEADLETDIDAEIARQLWKNHRLIPPTSKFARYWFSFIIFLVLVRTMPEAMPRSGCACCSTLQHLTGMLYHVSSTMQFISLSSSALKGSLATSILSILLSVRCGHLPPILYSYKQQRAQHGRGLLLPHPE